MARSYHRPLNNGGAVDLFGFFARRRAYRSLVDEHAAELLESDEALAYYNARRIARMAADRGDARGYSMWSAVAREVAKRTDHEIGKKPSWDRSPDGRHGGY
jgi:hypothetical protein